MITLNSPNRLGFVRSGSVFSLQWELKFRIDIHTNCRHREEFFPCFNACLNDFDVELFLKSAAREKRKMKFNGNVKTRKE